MVPSFFNPLDPLGGIKDDLLDLYTKMTDLFEQIIINPPTASGDLSDLYSMAHTTAIWYAQTVLLLVVVLSALTFRKFDRVGKAFLVFVVCVVFIPVFDKLVDEMVAFGNDFAAAMDFYDPPADAPVVPGIAGVQSLTGSIAGLVVALFWGVTLTALISSYQILIVVFRFWGPLAYSISAFGKRSKAFSNAILSLGIVATMFGRPFAVFFLEMGQVAIYTMPLGRTFFVSYVFTIMSYVAAIISQFVLFAVAYSGVKWVEGTVAALVTGKVVSTIKNKVDIQQHTNANHARGFRKAAAHEVGREATKEVAKASVKAGTKVAAAGATMAAMKVASSTHPVAKVAVVGATAASRFGGKFKKPGG